MALLCLLVMMALSNQFVRGFWVKVLSHDVAGGVFNDTDVLRKNPEAPSSLLFSVLDTVSQYQMSDGTFHLKMCYPDFDQPAPFCNEWTQTSNPVTESTITDYQAVSIEWGGVKGLGMNTQAVRTCAYIDATPQHTDCWGAVGAIHSYYIDKFGGNRLAGIGRWVTKVELYVKQQGSTTTTSTTTTTTTPTPTKWSGQCVEDDGTRLLDDGNNPPNNSPATCIHLCASKGFLFAGVQFTSQCFCGNVAPPIHRIKPQTDCNMRCNGDPSQYCGGSLRMNVYTTPGEEECCETLQIAAKHVTDGKYKKDGFHNGKPTYRNGIWCVFYGGHWKVDRCTFFDPPGSPGGGDWSQGYVWTKAKYACPGTVGAQWRYYSWTGGSNSGPVDTSIVLRCVATTTTTTTPTTATTTTTETTTLTTTTTTTTTTAKCVIDRGYDYSFHGVPGKGNLLVSSQSECANMCYEEPRCNYWTHAASQKMCWLKTSNVGRKPYEITVSGSKACGATCPDTGCSIQFKDAVCVNVKDGNWRNISKSYNVTTPWKEGLCGEPSEDNCCRCFQRLPAVGCVDVNDGCQNAFQTYGGYGVCVDIRKDNLSMINFDVEQKKGLCNEDALDPECCQCFMRK